MSKLAQSKYMNTSYANINFTFKREIPISSTAQGAIFQMHFLI